MTKAREWEKRRQIVIACLALLVVFCTGYVLSLPAIAMVRPASCGLDEHTHTEACYAEVATLVCGMDEQPGHTHGEGCFSPEGELVCGLTESAGHTHDESCYSTVKVLTCGLTEHVHTDACYAVSEEAAEEPAAGAAELSVGDTAEYAAPTAVPETEGAAETVANVEATAAPETEGAAETVANVEATAAPVTEGAAEPAANVEATAAPETEGAADPAATAEPTAAPETVEAAPVSMPAQTFFGKTDDVAVYVEADEGAFPAETYMTVAPVVDETILNAAADTVDSEINSLCAVDICFFDNQNVEIQPQLPIRVTMATAAVMEPENTVVVHVDDAGAASQVENIETAEENVSFEAGSFSVYVIVGKETVSTHVITADGENYEITVTYGKESGLPSEGVTLKAVEIPESSEVYSSYVDKVDEALGESKTVSHAKLFDITILVNGEEVQPQAPVQVSIKLQDMPVAEEQDVEVVHFEETEAASEDSANVKILSQDSVTLDRSGENVNSVEFSANGFSFYAVVVTETITTEHIDSFGTKYEITVTYGPEAQIPDGSWLSVTDIEEGTAEYERARNAVLADKQAKGEEVFLPEFGFAALDISIIDPYGQEIEPAAPVQVDIKIKELPNVENLDDVANSIEIQHHIETGDKVVVDTVYDGGATEAKFDVATNEEAIAEGTAVDPNSVNLEDYNPKDINPPKTVDLSFETGVFSTYSISWGNRTYNIHYVDTNGNSLTPTITPSYSNSDMFLIYDIEGYEYDSTHLSSITGTAIRPYIENYNNDRIYQTTGGSWYYLRNDIYVVYKAKPTPTQGGTPQVDQEETWPEGNDAPQFKKSSKNNGNGTNTVSLSIKAAEKPVEKSTPADVIVVFDVSGSMNEYMGNQRRLARAKTAVNTMADTLLRGSNNDVRMALISFSTDAEVVQGFTDNYTTYSGKVNGLTQGGGTNWEKALKLANEMQVRSNAATFVVFVTDGDPTFRVSRGNVSDSGLDMFYSNQNDIYTYYMSNNVFGDGNYDNAGRNLAFAVDQVSAIAGANKRFYAIGISDDVTKVQNLTTQGGVAADHAFIASDSTAMENAFKSITEAIKATLGFGAVEITDGITDLTSTRMEMLHTVDASSFKYYRYGGEGNKYGADEAHKTEWTTREADGCGPASYDEDTGAVEWKMGDTFQLEDGVTYVVEFTTWPSQEAYDLVADLNNGIKTYDSLSDEEKAQVVALNTNPVTYALKTNTDTVNATYKKTTETGGTVTISDDQPINATYTPGIMENMALQSMKLTIKKVFEDDLTGGEDRETQITLVLKRRNANQIPEAEFTDYAVPQGGTTSANIVLNEGNEWKYELYVAPGFKIGNDVLEHGYDFTITEPGIDYHYDLVEEIINPMVVDGTETYYGDGELLNGETIDEYIDRSLTAVNRVKSGIDIAKHVYDTDGTTEIYPDTEFTITGKLLDPDAHSYTWQDGDDVNASGAYHKYTLDPEAVPGVNGAIEVDGKTYRRIEYKQHFANSSNISFTLKAGEIIRFINVPEGCTFEFTESTTGMDDQGYEWKSTEAVTQHRTRPGGPFTTQGDVQPVVSNQTASLNSGVVGNKQYSITYGNKRTMALPAFELVKVDQYDNTKKLNGAKFTLYSDAGLTTPVTVDGNGNPIDIVTGNKAGSTGPDGWYRIGLLPAGTYYLVETSEPFGYVLDETPVIITVTKGESSYTVTATKNGNSVITGPTDGVYTITVTNERASKYVRVFKYETGTNPEKALKGAQFTLAVPEGTGSDYTGLPTGEDGYLVFSDGKTYIELPADTNPYTLTETKAPDGYNILSEVVKFTVKSDGVTGTYVFGPTTETIDGVEVTVYTIKVQNSAGVELPHTGGSGAVLYTLGGLMLLMTSALMYGFRMRRRERRFN